MHQDTAQLRRVIKSIIVSQKDCNSFILFLLFYHPSEEVLALNCDRMFYYSGFCLESFLGIQKNPLPSLGLNPRDGSSRCFASVRDNPESFILLNTMPYISPSHGLLKHLDMP